MSAEQSFHLGWSLASIPCHVEGACNKNWSNESLLCDGLVCVLNLLEASDIQPALRCLKIIPPALKLLQINSCPELIAWAPPAEPRGEKKPFFCANFGR